MEFFEERGIAYCGLACVLCSKDCPGCAATYNLKADDAQVIQCAKDKGVGGCFACTDYPCGKENDDCFIKQCVRKKGLDGCFSCPDYPCGQDWHMLNQKKNKAFIRYAREFGKQALIDRLRSNHESGITYHKPGTCKGEYDALKTEEDIYQLLCYGRKPTAFTRIIDRLKR